MEKYKILICEDDVEIGNAIEVYLKNQGYDVLRAYNGQEGLDIIESQEVHLAIVDLMMPVMDGMTMIVKVREKVDIPLIILSAKSEEIDKILGLNMGADDYIIKPFTPLELLARVHSHLRRYSMMMNLKEGSKNQELIYEVGGLELNCDTKEVFLDGTPIKLTPIEFKILQLLMKTPGRVYSAEEIYEMVWNEEAIATDTVMVHIRKIREKIEMDPRHPRYLKVVWGVGYKIEK